MSASNALILDSLPDGITRARLNRPEAANALNTAMALEIKAFFSAPPAPARVIILTGAGKHFCAGADLKERKGMSEEAWKEQHRAFRQARDAILHCPLPVIACVQGAAFGGGLELALACDFIYAAREANFALPEASLGIMPGMGGTQTLARAVGNRRARELLYGAKKFTAEDAFQWGMVNRLCDAATLEEDTLACAKAIAANAPLAVKAIKQAVKDGADVPLDAALQQELTLYNGLLSTADRHEGINAHNEKRKPVFSGK